MFKLIGQVEIGVVTGFGLPHFPQDFEPALTQAAERSGVSFSSGPQLLVIHLSPGAELTAQIGP